MRILIALMLLIGPLAACKTTVQEGSTRVTVEDGDRYDYDRPRHCPPGHAKKGWC